VAYAKKLHEIVTWIGICDGNMQEGSFRCDANVSVRKPGAALGTRREIKNLNSFKFMQQAIDYEVRWQIEEIEEGRDIQQATVLFNPDTGETRAMRTKEDAADYRYFPDPDLPPLVIGRDWVERVRSEMVELPWVMAARFVNNYGLTEYDAAQLTQRKTFAEFFERTTALCSQAKLAANWVINDVRRFYADGARDDDGPWAQAVREDGELIRVPATTLAKIISLIVNDMISNASAKKLFLEFWAAEKPVQPEDVETIIDANGLRQMNDSSALEAIIDEMLAANAKNVEEYKAGNAKAFNALVGQAMKASKGKANPAQVNELLKSKLG
jgi:aspartyl-tRNA(Asn)/glutamyl-tRNA(Gln) amidotransferase subunit B